MRFTFVMAYHDRAEQLNKTLESLVQYYPYNFSVVIVDDNSPQEIILPRLPFEVTRLKSIRRKGTNPASVFNIGFYNALQRNADAIIIQNPECYHYTNILNYAEKITDKTYISFGCYSQVEGEAIGSVFNNVRTIADGDSAWYNHPVLLPRGYHYCSVITPDNLAKLNGFDERFNDGICFDDDDFIRRVRKLGLEVEITTEPFVIHQWHKRSPDPDCGVSWARNRDLFEQLAREDNYQAVHTITPDLTWNPK